MNITFLAGYFMPEKSADTHLNYDLVTDFAKLGAKVNVIVPFPNRGLTQSQVDKYSEMRVDEIEDNLVVHRVGRKTKFKNGIVARAFSFIEKTFVQYCESKKYKTDCFFVVSTPPFLGYIAILLSKRAPVVYKLQDVFPDNLIEIKGWSENNIIIRVLRKMEKKVYDSVAKILVCSEDVKKTLVSRGVSGNKIRVIHDWVDENSCIPVEKSKNSLFDEFGIDRDRFTFVYAGNIGHMQNIDTILDAAKILIKKEIDVQIVIIGDGACKDRIDARIDTENITNIIRLPMQPLEKVSMVYSMGEVGLVSLKPGVAKTALPSKTWSIMSAARPVICEIDDDCELVTIVEENGLGICVSPGNADEFAEAMIRFYDMDRDELSKIGSRCRGYIENELNREKSTGKYFIEVNEVIESIKGD